MRRTALVADIVDARRCHIFLPSSSKVKVFTFFPFVGLTGETMVPRARCLDPATRTRSKNAENDDFEGEEREETR